MSSVAEQLQEYQGQLEEVETLLQDSPFDESLLSLQADLLELIRITAESSNTTEDVEERQTEQKVAGSSNALDEALTLAVGQSAVLDDDNNSNDRTETRRSEAEHYAQTFDQAASAAASLPETNDKKRKKPKKPKRTFEVPPHLVLQDTDTTAEQNKKKRAVKALKNKWRESVKTFESEQKQKSWQSFQKKKKYKKSSMFQSSDDAVGTVQARKLTDFGDRKRLK